MSRKVLKQYNNKLNDHLKTLSQIRTVYRTNDPLKRLAINNARKQFVNSIRVISL